MDCGSNARRVFQCSSASRKFLKKERTAGERGEIGGFSALQRAENSSKEVAKALDEVEATFQCSSASRKFLKYAVRTRVRGAESAFQCSSASRKFLKTVIDIKTVSAKECFSALQRAENSSNSDHAAQYQPTSHVSVLFSEPKIPQICSFHRNAVTKSSVSVLFSEPKIPQMPVTVAGEVGRVDVSVLFSEPKIPQTDRVSPPRTRLARFSALQRAENSSNLRRNLVCAVEHNLVSVLFSEPKIPQSVTTTA